MRRIVLWVMSTVTVLVLLFGYHTSTSSKQAADDSGVLASPVQGGTGSGPATGDGTGSATTGSGTTGSGTTGSGTTGSGTTGQSRTVTGDSADTRWGPVQVRLTVAAGRITNVSVIDYPQNNRRDRQINARALPILVQETLKAQSADIDMVTGATVTSEGYLDSLQSALDRAGL